ncbi:hypothetical protein AB5I39_13200 [Sphingomonas sp. MMS24-J45]|uniref:hypothetical protein n=1 Tax=Sphingomonas sp. MMS24-J45 TaxID=3238806 RepID=UPI00384B4771
MNTPFDAALRLRQREMDAMRVSIAVQVNQLMVIEETRENVDRSVRRETEIAASNWGSSAHAFMARMRAQRERLVRERATVNARLTALREQATEAYGALRAIEGAAARFREEADRAAATAEQNRADDFSAARYSRAQDMIRRARLTTDRDAV